MRARRSCTEKKKVVGDCNERRMIVGVRATSCAVLTQTNKVLAKTIEKSQQDYFARLRVPIFRGQVR